MDSQPLALEPPPRISVRMPSAAYWKLAAVWALSAACLVWALRGLPLAGFADQVRAVSWDWVAAAILLDVLSYLCQGLRWTLLLRPLGRLPWLKSTQAVYAGLFTNEVLPLRLGEGVRGWLVSRWLARPFTEVLPSIVLERVMDGAVLAAAALAMCAAVRLPASLARAVETLCGVIGLAAVALAVLLLKRRGRVARCLGAALGGNRAAAAFALSAAFLSCQAVSLWCAMRSYGLDLAPWKGFAALVILRILTSVPGAPANLGTWQAACVLALTLFGAPRDLAAGFSVFGFLVLTVPLWLLGMLSLARSGARLGDLRRETASPPSAVL